MVREYTPMQRIDRRDQDVPGTRWFKADLHIHTIDDLAGSRVRVPGGMSGSMQSPENILEYSRRFLQSAVDRGVGILGITPHAPYQGASHQASTVWQIVDEWNTGVDNQGIPFREFIYAIFPGFEPSFNNGKSGLHLLFLFDPEIGRDTFMNAFNLIMGNVPPWPEGSGNLRMSGLNAEDALKRLREFHEAETRDNTGWEYMVLAPHIESDKGLLGALKAQVLERFPHSEIAGLELGPNKLPQDALEGRAWLRGSMAMYNQSFYHGTDAYDINKIGDRHTWIKIASPKIAALRQAFIAGDSRIRIGYERADAILSQIPNAPDALNNGRPWLRSVTVSGRASFFGGGNDKETTRFDFSPDLTCIIGGSMTGKSTLLDGLRTYVKAPPPENVNIREQVKSRGENFLAGSANIVLDCPGRDTTTPLHEQWPAVFYTQSELQRLAENPHIVEMLSRLAGSESSAIREREECLDGLDKDMADAAVRWGAISDRLADAQQACERSEKAAEETAAFAQAGIDDLVGASAETRRWQASAVTTCRLADGITSMIDEAAEVDIANTRDMPEDLPHGELNDRWSRVLYHLRQAKEEAGVANACISSIIKYTERRQTSVRVAVDRQLAEMGFDGARIGQIRTINTQASLLESYRANLQHIRDELAKADESSYMQHAQRNKLVELQRDAFNRVIAMVHHKLGGRIRILRVDNGDKHGLHAFLKSLAQRGITRWWNDMPEEQQPTPEDLLEAAETGGFGMSAAVQESLRASLTPIRRRQAAALRCTDTYRLELRMDDGTYRQLADLSGGQRVNVLLSLLLETDDERPLVIDQPEDDLDNRFLFETLLPILRRLKGRRQIILATHNANIVVNGDADQVIHLEATARHGRVANSGAIEEPAVRDAIVRTVDGGKAAFALRRLKYGF